MLALLSVSDKTGIVELAKGLQDMGVGILSTGGTMKVLQENGVEVRSVSDYTGFPEMMDGRVKTLHPKIHAGLLALRGNKEHMAQLKEQGIEPIGLVAVNLYPFEDTIKKECSYEEAIENIDIGGPTMLRSAAKNHESVAVVVDPDDYSLVLGELKKGNVSEDTRKMLARKVFEHTARYDSAISGYLGGEEKFPNVLCLGYVKAMDLRYGENPHQEAAFYVEPAIKGSCLANAKQLHGKELSFNNILDMDSALKLIKEFGETAAVVLKHNNPCGVAVGKTLAEAYRKAHSTDAMSAFGGIVALNEVVDAETAGEISKTFIECVIAPGYDKDALSMLEKKKNIRLMQAAGKLKGEKGSKGLSMKQVVGGMLVQDRDLELFKGELKVTTKRAPTKDELEAMTFALKVCKHTKSNTVIYATSDRTIGIGAGQMSRVDSARLGAMKAKDAGLETKGTVLASDAFFPFRDAVDAAAKAGVTAIIQPGGSIRDKEVIGACDEHNIAMVFSGMRHFNH